MRFLLISIRRRFLLRFGLIEVTDVHAQPFRYPLSEDDGAVGALFAAYRDGLASLVVLHGLLDDLAGLWAIHIVRQRPDVDVAVGNGLIPLRVTEG